MTSVNFRAAAWAAKELGCRTRFQKKVRFAIAIAWLIAVVVIPVVLWLPFLVGSLVYIIIIERAWMNFSEWNPGPWERMFNGVVSVWDYRTDRIKAWRDRDP